MTAVVAVMDLHDSVRTIQRDVRQALLVDDPAAVCAWQASVAASKEKIAADTAELEHILYLPAGQAKLATLKKAHAERNGHLEKVTSLAAKGDREAASQTSGVVQQVTQAVQNGNGLVIVTFTP
jgi:hypothetical protein